MSSVLGMSLIEKIRESDATVLTVTQVTALLSDIEGRQLDERTVRRACEDGQLPCIHVGRRVLIPRERLLALLTVAA